MRLYLASTSPARLTLLRSAGVRPLTIASHVDEDAAVAVHQAEHGAPTTAQMVQLLARAKAEAVCDLEVEGEPIDGFILGGDSAFNIDGITYGKPHDPRVARERWMLQRGRTGILYSGHWLIDHRRGSAHEGIGAVTEASVTFADDITDDEIDAYIATGEPLSVAGAFTIDSLGGPFITRVEGDPSTVVGMSLSTVRSLVRQLGVEWTSLWNEL